VALAAEAICMVASAHESQPIDQIVFLQQFHSFFAILRQWNIAARALVTLIQQKRRMPRQGTRDCNSRYGPEVETGYAQHGKT
jgi:hypothetical protein